MPLFRRLGRSFTEGISDAFARPQRLTAVLFVLVVGLSVTSVYYGVLASRVEAKMTEAIAQGSFTWTVRSAEGEVSAARCVELNKLSFVNGSAALSSETPVSLLNTGLTAEVQLLYGNEGVLRGDTTDLVGGALVGGAVMEDLQTNHLSVLTAGTLSAHEISGSLTDERFSQYSNSLIFIKPIVNADLCVVEIHPIYVSDFDNFFTGWFLDDQVIVNRVSTQLLRELDFDLQLANSKLVERLTIIGLFAVTAFPVILDRREIGLLLTLGWSRPSIHLRYTIAFAFLLAIAVPLSAIVVRLAHYIGLTTGEVSQYLGISRLLRVVAWVQLLHLLHLAAWMLRSPRSLLLGQ